MKENGSEEAWERIPRFPDYEVSVNGFVRNAKTKQILLPYFNKRAKKWQVVLSIDGERHCVLIHRLMAEAFCFDDEGKFRLVAFRDGNPNNLSLSNLMIYNVDGIVESNDFDSKWSPWPKAVINKTTGVYFESVQACAAYYNCWPSTISHAIYQGQVYRGCYFDFAKNSGPNMEGEG